MTGHDQHSRKQQTKPPGQSSNKKVTKDVKAEHSLRDVSFTAQLKQQGSQTAEATLQTEARRLLLDSNPDLAERRKALAKAAFVRHDTTDIVENMKRYRLAGLLNPQSDNSQPCASHDKQPLLSPVASQYGSKSDMFGTLPGRSNWPLPTEPSCEASYRLSLNTQSLTTQSCSHIQGLSTNTLDSLRDPGSFASFQTIMQSPRDVNNRNDVDGLESALQPSLREQHDTKVLLARQQLDAYAVPPTPLGMRRNIETFVPPVPGTLNGVGHPLTNDLALLPEGATEPLFVFKRKARDVGFNAGEGLGLEDANMIGNVLLPGQGSKAIKKLNSAPACTDAIQPLNNTKVDAACTQPANNPRTKPDVHRATIQPGNNNRGPQSFLNTLPTTSDAKPNRPLSNDTLNLWRGKRLTGSEMKIEARLHRLRHNPTAKVELQERVAALLADKEAELAESLAQQLFASERREQKALTFLERQARYAPMSRSPEGSARPGAISPKSNRRGPIMGVAALFDPQSGEPIQDANPLPASSTGRWMGHVMLSRVLHALSEGLAAARWARDTFDKSQAAATCIQANWRGYRTRKVIQTQRARREYIARTSRKIKLGLSEESAAHVILQFLQDYDKAGRHGAAIAAMKQVVAGVGHERARSEIVRAMRIAMLVRQWSNVETAAIEVCNRRARGKAALGIQGPVPGQGRKSANQLLADRLEARRKGSMSNMYAEDREARIRASTDEALSKTFINDRIILEDCKPVPQAVKAAIVGVYLDQKMHAYTALVGRIWQLRAQWRYDKRAEDAKTLAQGVMAASPIPPQAPPSPLDELLAGFEFDEAPPPPASPSKQQQQRQPSPPVHKHTTSDISMTLDKASSSSINGAGDVLLGAASPDMMPGGDLMIRESQSTLPHAPTFRVDAMSHLDRSLPISARELPRLPGFRVLATPMELKAVMQQGVQEVPVYQAYMMTSALDDYEQQVTDHIMNKLKGADEKTKKAMVKASRAAQGNNSLMSKLSKTGPGSSDVKPAVVSRPEVSSFTIALLLHRWRSECIPKAKACLVKRYGLLKVDLPDCLASTRVWSNEEVGQHLQNLVA